MTASWRAFKADPDHGPVMDSGLWKFTRHPNYFGDACVWVGIFLIAAEHWPGVLTIVSTALMVYLLAFGSGKRVLGGTWPNAPAIGRTCNAPRASSRCRPAAESRRSKPEHATTSAAPLFVMRIDTLRWQRIRRGS